MPEVPLDFPGDPKVLAEAISGLITKSLLSNILKICSKIQIHFYTNE